MVSWWADGLKSRVVGSLVGQLVGWSGSQISPRLRAVLWDPPVRPFHKIPSD